MYYQRFMYELYIYEAIFDVNSAVVSAVALVVSVIVVVIVKCQLYRSCTRRWVEQRNLIGINVLFCRFCHLLVCHHRLHFQNAIISCRCLWVFGVVPLCVCARGKTIKLNSTRKFMFAVGGWFSAWQRDNKNKLTNQRVTGLKTTTSIFFFSIIFCRITLHYRFGLSRHLTVKGKFLFAGETAKSVAIFPRRMCASVNFTHS